ncbi:hypothetical protein OG900_06310 [Streptomyces sp. NBC_00433]
MAFFVILRFFLAIFGHISLRFPLARGLRRQRNDLARYLYWSDRSVRELAEDNGISLTRSWYPTSVKTPGTIAGIPAPQMEFSPTGGQDHDRREIARKVMRAVIHQANVAFESPPPAHFAQGVGRVDFARFLGGPQADKGVMLHIATSSTSGERVDLILFGSLDNLAGFRRSDAIDTGWYSSAWYAVAELLESRGTRNTSQWDDEESRSLEILKIAVAQGTDSETDHESRPWARGYSLGRAEQAEWLAHIYTHVRVDPQRWDLRGDPCEGAGQILIGAPLWVRTASPQAVVRYGKLRSAHGRR